MNHKYELQSFEKISKLHSVLEDEKCYGKKEYIYIYIHTYIYIYIYQDEGNQVFHRENSFIFK